MILCEKDNGIAGLVVNDKGEIEHRVFEGAKRLIEQADVIYFLADDPVDCDNISNCEWSRA